MDAHPRLATLAALVLMAGTLSAQEPAATELGAVRWERDFAAGVAAARAKGKPVFLFFTEIPGCANCTGAGVAFMRNELLVEAIETAFVAIAIRNNVGGAEGAVLKQFGEPAWNNPVVRLVDAEGHDLAPRLENLQSRTPAELARAMVAALQAGRRPVPGYLELLADQQARPKLRHATFAMDCFWEGEAALGALRGVNATRTGSVGGREVVWVEYDEARLSFAALLKKATELRCAQGVWVDDAERASAAKAVVGQVAVRGDPVVVDAPASDQKHALGRTPWKWVPMLESQRSRANAAVAKGEDPAWWLSARQVAIGDLVRAALAANAGALDGLGVPPAESGTWNGWETAIRACTVPAKR